MRRNLIALAVLAGLITSSAVAAASHLPSALPRVYLASAGPTFGVAVVIWRSRP
jgi:hypothetical protein